MLMPSRPLPARRARETLRTSASTPSWLKPMRLISACCRGRRNRRGAGLPAGGRGVTVPTSTKPKPSPSSASTCSPFLSSPAARPTGLGNASPSTLVTSGATGGASNRPSALPCTRSSARKVTPCARSASIENSSGRSIRYISLAPSPPFPVPRSLFPLFAPGLQVELDPLRQRQRIRVIDRVRLPPHVGLPRIRARFPATAGLLLAAEGAADLGPGGADVDVGDAAVRTGRRQEFLRRLQVVGEDGRGQALRHVVLH